MGIEGWGEPIVEGRADTVKTAVLELSEYLIGENALIIEDHWQKIYRGGFDRGSHINECSCRNRSGTMGYKI